MPAYELTTDENEDSLHRVVWHVIVAHQRQRPELYSGASVENRLYELAIVIGKMITCEAIDYGSTHTEAETVFRASNLAAIVQGHITQQVLLYVRQIRFSATPPDDHGVGKAS